MVSQIGNSSYSYEVLNADKTSTVQSSFPSIHAFFSDEYMGSSSQNSIDFLSMGGIKPIFAKPHCYEGYKNQEMAKMKSEIVAKDAEEAGKLSREEFLQRMNEYNKKIEDRDFEKEYQDYMQGRGCKNEKELKILNRFCMDTMDDFLEYVGSSLNADLADLTCNNLIPRDCNVNFRDYVQDMDIDNIVNYLEDRDKASSFMNRVSVFKSFVEKISTSDSFDSFTSRAFSEIASAIENAKDDIKIFSDKIEEQNKQFRAQDEQNNNQKYNEKLIAQYQY